MRSKKAGVIKTMIAAPLLGGLLWWHESTQSFVPFIFFFGLGYGGMITAWIIRKFIHNRQS
jgi:hypothetical protein